MLTDSFRASADGANHADLTESRPSPFSDKQNERLGRKFSLQLS